MKKQLIMSVIILAIVAALIGGATMAWFSDVAVSDDVSFSAGTLLIEANSSLIYGVEQTTGDLFEIDPTTGIKHRIYETPNFSGTNINSPNGLAYDNKNHRLYFAVYDSDEDPAKNSMLYFYDFDGNHHEAGLVEGIVAGACYGRGYFWYIKNETDDLYKVSFDPVNGEVDQVIPAYESFTDGEKTFRFGDVAMESFGNMLYGSSLQSGSTSPEFFQVDLSNGVYEPIAIGGSSSRLQLAFGANGVLYGHSAGTREWYSIDTATGDATELTWSSGDKVFTDLASNWQNNWNPGDCDIARFYVRNTGTKNSYIRFKWYESFWGFEPEVLDVVSIEPCEPTWAVNPDAPDDGYLYYQGELSPNEEILLCIRICFSGDDAGDEYQGQVFTLKPVFEAIQTTHDASADPDEWGWPGP